MELKLMDNFWSTARWKRPVSEVDADPPGWRSFFQQDYDRLLFSTPVRRLADKTQVWPMEENDGVRTRLTHSHEVANLARSIGSRIALQEDKPFGEADLYRTIQPILAAIGLAHDLGNPPFGHQGEAAIGQWFKNRAGWIFTRQTETGDPLSESVPEELRSEFIKFDGNPQTFRLITRLQTHTRHVGLDLTAGTLIASLKYPVGARTIAAKATTYKKAGYFESEREIVEWARQVTGFRENERHPLTWIMEACDDIAYSVLDVDDVMKKRIISPDDVLAILLHHPQTHDNSAVKRAQKSFGEIQASGRDADVARDIKIGILRACLIEDLIQYASDAFSESLMGIMGKTHQTEIMKKSKLCETLKDVAKKHAFANPAVLRMEAIGAKALDDLMTFFWKAISERTDFENFSSRRTNAVAQYGWSLVSANYIEEASARREEKGSHASVRYRELRLLTDMISGMTDSFALKRWEQIRKLPG
ncbi:deoxyguanosinetriphosphate triphosphohydrolase family protein [Rhizobium sp.]|uniref:deoxyguanosinetriphosphate triphosphohydrolase family protein n=1 Tax=Rhizobium sp. TaxID=391 RepID=UPI0034C69405